MWMSTSYIRRVFDPSGTHHRATALDTSTTRGDSITRADAGSVFVITINEAARKVIRSFLMAGVFDFPNHASSYVAGFRVGEG